MMKYVELPLLMVRENSIRTGELYKMQADKTISAYFDYLKNRDIFNESSEKVTDEIERCVKKYYDDNQADCKKLIELKREIFNKRYGRFDKYKYLLNKYEGLDETKEFFRKYEILVKMRDDINAYYEEEYNAARRILWDEWKSKPNLTCGLINYEENLFNKLKDYLEKPASEHNNKIKKLDNTLLKIYTRAVLKPSPFSTFCGIKMEIDDIGKPGSESRKESVIQINYVHVLRIWDMLSRSDEVKKRLHYRVNYSMRKDGNSYSVSKLIDMPEENGKLFEGKTILVRIPESEVLNRLNELRGSKSIYSYDELTEKLGVGGNKDVIPYLVEKKLVDSVEKLDEIPKGIIPSFINKMSEWGLDDIERVKEIISVLEKINRSLKSAASEDDWEKRKEFLTEIRQYLDDIYKSFGRDKWCEKNLIYEDYLSREISKTDFTVSEENRKTIELLSELNLLFDVNARTQCMFAKKFVSKYGNESVHTSDPTLISRIIDSNKNYNYMWDNNMMVESHEDDPDIVKQMDALKAELIDYLRTGIYGCASGILKLDTEYIKGIIDRIPGEIRARKKSFEYFLQKTKDGLVVNNVYSGYMMYYSRFLQYFPDLWTSKQFKDYLNTVFNGDEKVCDMRIASGFNGNIRPQITEYELILPSQRKTDATSIDYRECCYRYDERENRVKLHHESIGDFTTISMGSLMPLYLPGITGLLHSIFVNSLAFKDFNKLDIRSDDEIVRFPRICVDDVCICRQSWRIPNSVFEQIIERSADNCELFCNLNKWISDRDIPSNVFIRKDLHKDMADIFLGKADGKNLDMAARKPQSIDFHNPLSVLLLVKMCSDGHDFILEEAYPDYSNADCNVQEGVYELSCV